LEVDCVTDVTDYSKHCPGGLGQISSGQETLERLAGRD